MSLFKTFLLVPFLALSAACADDDTSGTTNGNGFGCVAPVTAYDQCTQTTGGNPATCAATGGTLVTSCPSTLPVVGCCTTSSMQVCTQTNATATTLEGVLLGTKQGCMAQGGTWSPTRSP